MNKAHLKKYYYLPFLIFTLFLFGPALCAGQQVTFEPVQIPDLPAGTYLSGMCQDNNGFIWMASIANNNLFRYDGEKLTAYMQDGNDQDSNASGHLECVYADSKGYIWIGSFENGLYKLNPETEEFEWFHHKTNDAATIRSDSIRAIIESRDGIIWIGTGRGLDSLDPQTGKFTHVDYPSKTGRNLSREHIRALYEDKAGIIWIGCGSPFPADDAVSKPGGLYKLDRNTGLVTHFQHIEGDEHSLADNRVRSILEDSRGVFWVGTAGANGLQIMDRDKGTFQRFPYDPKNPEKLSRPPVVNEYSYAVDHITFITEDAEGFIWIGTFCNGLNRYNPTTKTVEHFGETEKGTNKIEYDNLWYCTKTKDNQLWISTWVPGDTRPTLYKVSILSNKVNQTFTGVSVRDVKIDEEGILWLGTRDGLLMKTSNNRYKHFLIDKDTLSFKNRILSIEPDSLNNLWLSTQYGLSYFSKKSQSFTTYLHDPGNSNSIASNYVFSTLLNNDGTIWVGTNRGLDLLNPGSKTVKHFVIFPESSDDTVIIRDNIIYSVIRDRSGNIWVGSGSGLYHFNPETGHFKELVRKHLFDANSLCGDNKRRIWAGTNGYGLYVKNPNSEEFTLFKDSTGVLKNTLVIGGITTDKQNLLWINSSKGLIRLNPETKNAVLFAKSWGIDPNLVNYKIYTSADGEIFLGNANGYFHFYPNDFKQPVEDLTNLYLGNLHINNKQILPGTSEILPLPLSKMKKLTLNYLQNTFSIEYNNIDFVTSESEKNVLYKLENFDDIWRKQVDDNQAVYYNVSPGKYIFRVKASNMYGNWTEKSLEIVIKPPWYKTALAYIIYALLFIAAVYVFDRVMRRRIVQRERQRTQERELAQAKEIEKAYKVLKTTQAQLIQSEKMASLGELTAGIAHEIQNPLNFVNNFSDLNKELADELEQEIEKKNYSEAKVLVKDIKDNENKINHHGRRAESIVKGMLMHSRGSSGQKELTDINSLCDEYLRLSFHGFRAKDKSFNADFKLEADESLPKINVVPQDIGRVLLNLINNAFFAVSSKASTTEEIEYNPKITLQTRLLKSSSGKSKIEIRILDNGPGIPENIKEKIFQPFFTTKPTGQGTGLGLSLSYDIIKAHGGELKMEACLPKRQRRQGKKVKEAHL